MKKQLLISSSDIKELTIWKTKAKLDRARSEGLVIMVKMPGKIRYDLNSVDPRFLKQTA